jgi:hypothetical protein
MDALSTSIEVEFSPNVADAEEDSASITSAMLASNTIELRLCVRSGVVTPGLKQGFGCMRFLLSDSPRFREWADLFGSYGIHLQTLSAVGQEIA